MKTSSNTLQHVALFLDHIFRCWRLTSFTFFTYLYRGLPQRLARVCMAVRVWGCESIYSTQILRLMWMINLLELAGLILYVWWGGGYFNRRQETVSASYPGSSPCRWAWVWSYVISRFMAYLLSQSSCKCLQRRFTMTVDTWSTVAYNWLLLASHSTCTPDIQWYTYTSVTGQWPWTPSSTR